MFVKTSEELGYSGGHMALTLDTSVLLSCVMVARNALNVVVEVRPLAEQLVW